MSKQVITKPRMSPSTSFDRLASYPHRVPSVPTPWSSSPQDGMETARAYARQYLPNAVRLFAGIAFGEDSEAAMHTRYLVVKELLAIAGMIPQPTPTAPPPGGVDDDDRASPASDASGNGNGNGSEPS